MRIQTSGESKISESELIDITASVPGKISSVISPKAAKYIQLLQRETGIDYFADAQYREDLTKAAAIGLENCLDSSVQIVLGTTGVMQMP